MVSVATKNDVDLAFSRGQLCFSLTSITLASVNGKHHYGVLREASMEQNIKIITFILKN